MTSVSKPPGPPSMWPANAPCCSKVKVSWFSAAPSRYSKVENVIPATVPAPWLVDRPVRVGCRSDQCVPAEVAGNRNRHDELAAAEVDGQAVVGLCTFDDHGGDAAEVLGVDLSAADKFQLAAVHTQAVVSIRWQVPVAVAVPPATDHST